MIARRFDELNPTPLLSPHRRESDGAVLAECVVVREGVYTYRRADGGVRRELVTMDAVRATASSIGRASTTLEHPPEFVSPENVDKFGTGDVDGEVTVVEDEAQGGYVRVRVALRRKDAIADFDSGKRVEVSPGYEVVLDETPGDHPRWGRYDARQIGRTVNHLAQVETARGGPTVRLNTDSDDAVCVRAPPPKRTDTMNPTLVKLAALFGIARTDSDDGVLAEVLPAAERMKTRADEAEGEVEKAKDAEAEMKEKLEEKDAEIEKLTGERDALKAKVDEYEKEAKDRKDAADLERVTKLATKVGVKTDGLDLSALRLAVARTAIKDLPETVSAARLDGILDVLEAQPEDKRYDGWKGNPEPKLRNDSEPAPVVDPWARHDDNHAKIHGSTR